MSFKTILTTLALLTIAAALSAGPLDLKQVGPVRVDKAAILANPAAVAPSIQQHDTPERPTLDDELVFSEGFENTVTGFIPSGWTVVDGDNGFCNQWNRHSVFQVFDYGQQNSHTGSRCALVHYNDAEAANNDWLIAPPLLAGSPLSLHYWASSQDPTFSESWEVRVSTSGRNPSDFSNLLETVTDAPATWIRHTVDLSAFAGQNIHIAWHYNSNNRYVLKLDDIDVEAASTGTSGAITGIIRYDRGQFPARPLEAATITVGETGLQTRSLADGSYALRYLAAGTYTLNVSHPNYVSFQLPNVVVNASQSTDSINAQILPAQRDSVEVRYLRLPPVDISDFDTATVTFNVTNNVSVYDINLFTNITHTWVGDLNIWLRSPAGETVQLMRSNINLSGDNLEATHFDDESSALLSEGQPPFSGRFRPYQALENFRGDAAQGTWTLQVFDEFAEDFGRMENCTLWVKFNTAAPLAADDPVISLNEFRLDGNYPNPFNPSTTFAFSLDRSDFATLKLYNIVGEEVATVLAGSLSAGPHTVEFDGSQLSTGIYFAKLTMAGQSATQKVVLLK